MKTATINVYRLFGTANEYCATVLYRNKELYSFMGKDGCEISFLCEKWAKNRGFTNVKYIYG